MRRIPWWKKMLLAFVFLAGSAIFVLFNFETGVTENIDEYVYALPFKKGTRYKMVQGYGGLFTHSHVAALDFAMPAGTPVLAAREGHVFSFKDDSDEGGFMPANRRKANYIMIRHSDGSIGCYWHLQKDGVQVKSGYVAKGQQIGLSGNTGQSLSPHLHFSVKKRLNYDMNSFVKTKFYTSEGILLLKEGNSYASPAD